MIEKVLQRYASDEGGKAMRNYEYVNGKRVRERGFFARWGHRLFVLMAIIGIICVLTFFFGWGKSKGVKNGGSREAIIAEEEKFHGIILTRDNVMEQLQEISELMTYSEDYAGTANVVDNLQIPYTDFDIWGTQHKIQIVYAGTIKVGYDLNDLKTVVNNQKKEIYITIPDKPIVDNNLPQEKVTVMQDNNVFNPIRADEVTVRLAEVKAQQLESAERNGIYEKAETHFKEIIINTLAKVHSEYKVVFLSPTEQPPKETTIDTSVAQ